MNVDMLNNKITQNNIKKLIDYGFIVYPPECGELACGVNASGRLPSIDIIYELVLLNTDDKINALKDKKVLISFGSTKTNIDSVRFITNSSSGLMGYALIKEAYYRGAGLSVLTNKATLDRYKDLSYYVKNIILINTTDEALIAIKDAFIACDIYISSMAFCDFKYNLKLNHKIKKQEKYIFEFEQAADVFKNLSSIKTDQIMLGFALEADSKNSIEYAKNKLKDKNMDLIVLNLTETINAKSSSFKIIDKSLNVFEYKSILKENFAKILFNKIEGL